MEYFQLTLAQWLDQSLSRLARPCRGITGRGGFFLRRRNRMRFGIELGEQMDGVIP